MAAEKKTSIHKHVHPAYGWIALVVSVTVILGVAGWYYATISQGYDSDLVNSVKEMSTPTKSISSANLSSPLNVATEVAAIDTGLASVPDGDYSDIQLDNTILGVQ